jgi:fermentation-respiration switch protein FrsA (DUF1100 family)
MSENDGSNYALLDHPQVTTVLFHPRPEPTGTPRRPSAHGRAEDMLIAVGGRVDVGARFHLSATEKAPNILFFHGNGEIVADYDDIGALYNQLGINFLAVDYRGYGRSGGTPTVTAMMRDCHRILDFADCMLQERKLVGPIIVMGRSLGSAPAIELASAHPNRLDGLIVESGFAAAAPLLRLLGVDPDRLGFDEDTGFRNVQKIAHIQQPTLIIHAERDHIIPFADGVTLYEACAAAQKTFLKIPDADHNTIFFAALREYLEAVKRFTEQVAGSRH